MNNYSRLLGVFACVAAFAIAGCAANSGMTPTSSAPAQQALGHALTGPGWIEKDGVLYHLPHYMVPRSMVNQNHIQPNILLTYYGGAVLPTPTVYVVFWQYDTYGDSKGVRSLLENYFTHMGGSGHNNIVTQYYEISGGNTVYITNPSGQYAGAWSDNTNPIPRHPTDSQVAAEALRAVAHFGYNANASYVVATAHGRSTSGFATQWCAYHSATTSSGKLVSYTNLPYMPDAGANCGSNIISPPSDESGTDEGVTIVEGHEYAESVTDPNPPSGWYNNSYGEIGDICAWTNIQNDPFGTYSYTSQPLFSNKTQSCVHSY